MAQWVKNLTSVAQTAVEAKVEAGAWVSGLKDLALPAVAQIQYLAWELPYVSGASIKKKNEAHFYS